MSVKTSIKDGQGTGREACVKETSLGENSLCTNISGITPGIIFPISPSIGGNQIIGDSSRFSKDGVGTIFDMTVDGTVPINFLVPAQVDKDFIITEIIFQAIGGQFKPSKFLSQNGPLTNGVSISQKSNNISSTYLPIFITSDFEVFSAIAGYNLTIEAAGDVLKATRSLLPAVIIRAKDTFGISDINQDFLQIKIQDDLLSINQMFGYINGFFTDPGVF